MSDKNATVECGWTQPSLERQPFSPNTAEKTSRLKGATATSGVCPYCAVGCGQLIYTKAGTIIDIEGDPNSPISEGTLCPKGASTFQLVHNSHRVTKALYRAPYGDIWEERKFTMDDVHVAIRARTVYLS